MSPVIKYRKVIIFSLFSLVLIHGFNQLFPLNLTRYQDHSVIVYSHNSRPLYVFPTMDEKWRLQATVQQVDALYLKTLLHREDRYFYVHPGINLYALLRAIWQRITTGRIISGGSTLTMQTARLLEPRPRTIVTKIIECWRALQLEYNYSKDEILAIYLTLAPFGGNIEGVKAASWRYFKKSPLFLKPAEIALLVALPQSPTQLTPHIANTKTIKARQKILAMMVAEGLTSITDAQLAHQDALPSIYEGFPKEAPHLAWRLKQQYPQQKYFITTIDHGLQQAAEHVLKTYERFLPMRANCAIMIMDHSTNDVVAYVGSRNFFDSSRDGQVDFTRAWRSPGSTLKPFIYAMGFSLGLVQPDSLVLDDHQRFGAYKPGNFDKDIHGVVTVHEALSLSLNIPVVNLLNQVGPIRFLGALKEMGIEIKYSHSLEAPTLAIALGGLGIRLEHLMMLYGGLARQGRVSPLRFLKSASVLPEHIFFSPLIAQQITRILQDSDGNFVDSITTPHTVAFKTGTSYGHRDTLAMGYDDRFIVGVWIGIPDGSPMGNVSGRSLAVPLMRRLFQILPKTTAHFPVKPVHRASLAMKNLQNESAHHQQMLRQDKPSLLFPIDNTVVSLKDDAGQPTSIPLSIAGGKRPYTWFVDGQPLVLNNWKQKHFWQPQQPGFYKISVMDAEGVIVQVAIEVR